MAQGPIGAAGPQQARGNTAPPGADPQRPAAKASLRVTALARDGSRSADFALRPDETRVGKGVGEDELRLDDPFVAPLHAAFLFEEGQLSIEDKGTRNGVFLCVAQRFLEVGDELRIGRQRLRIDRMPRPDSAQAAAPTGGGPQPLWGSPDPGYRMQLVQVLERGGDGDTFPLRLGENQIGRGLGDVSFPGDGYVSGRHATLEVSDEGLRITDLGSANGTFVRLSRRTPVQQGDVLLIGDQLLRIDPS
jgi:pSer/pThr/pTyr-binding forkhead associated (FHA) protein